MKCPHCKKDINPGAMLQARRKTKGGPNSEQAMAAGRKGAEKRWKGGAK